MRNYYNFEIEYTWGSIQLEQEKDSEVFVCEDWQDLDKFATWWKENYPTVEGEKTFFVTHLVDKRGKTFTPETCCLLPKKLKHLFSYRNPNYKGKNGHILPHGVTKSKTGYVVQIRDQLRNTIQYIGTYDTPDKAFLSFKTVKENIIRGMAIQYQTKISPQAYRILMEYKVELDD